MEFVLRPWSEDDLESLVAHANNEHIARYMTGRFPHPYGPADAMRFFEQIVPLPYSIIRAIEINGKAVGSVGIHQLDDIQIKNAEIGYWLSETYWGHGIATAAVQRMVPLAFEQLDIDRIFGRTFGTNIGSQRVLEKAGFTFEARFHQTIFKNGIYEDEIFYGVRREPIQ